MIEQLLTTALLAVSLNSPKRVIDTNNYSAPYVIALSYDGFSGAREFGARFLYGNEEVSLSWEYNSGTQQYNASSGNKDIGDGQGSDYVRGEAYYGVSNSVYSFTFYLNFGLDIRDYQTAYSYLTALNGTSGYDGGFSSWSTTNVGLDDEYDDGDYYVLTFAYRLSFNGANLAQGDTFYYSLGNYDPSPTYSVTKVFNNCHNSGNTSYIVPDSFKSSTLNNPYTIYVLADDGYFFKRDGSSYSFSSGVVVTNVDYGANPSGEALSYSSEMKITFAMPASDVSMTFTASALTLADANALYNQGYQDAKAIFENTNQFAWMKNIWTGMASFFAIEILPNISLGFLAFAPLLVVAIIAIVRIMKHD